MNSLSRMLKVLDLFKPEQPVIDVEIVCTQLGYTPASAYRYIRELMDAGLLARLPRGYALGPRVIELDRHMTDYDPLIQASRQWARDLVNQTGLEVLVSELYGDTVINVLEYAGVDDAPVSHGRGQPMDLSRSATARVILAYLLPRQLRRIYDSETHQHELLRLGADWRAFSKAMSAVRKQGYCISVGELDPGKIGVAAPIFDEKQRIFGSITLVGPIDRFKAFNESFLVDRIVAAARSISDQIAGMSST